MKSGSQRDGIDRHGLQAAGSWHMSPGTQEASKDFVCLHFAPSLWNASGVLHICVRLNGYVLWVLPASVTSPECQSYESMSVLKSARSKSYVCDALLSWGPTAMQKHCARKHELMHMANASMQHTKIHLINYYICELVAEPSE